MNRIETVFSTLKGKRAALIPFIMGYDPDAKTSMALLEALPAAGADLIEIGMPFSDPMADGPVIQAAGLRALSAGASVSKILEMVRAFRKTNQDTPIILMGYFNPVYRYGNERFCKDAAAAGVDGIILVDLPPEEEGEIRAPLEASGLKLIRLIAPTSLEDRLPMLTQSASGFVYYISVAGITGAKSATAASLKNALHKIRTATTLPIAVGFGIKTPEQAKDVAQLADAVVVGSALVEVLQRSGRDAAVAFVSSLSAALKP